MPGNRLQHAVGQGDLAGLAALGKPEDKHVAAEHLDLTADVNLAALQVEVIGGEGEALSLPEPETRAEHDDQRVAVGQLVAHRQHLLLSPRHELLRVGLGPANRRGLARVLREHPVVDRRSEDGGHVREHDLAVQARPAGRQPQVLLGERGDFAVLIRADPATLAPPQPHRAPERRDVDQLDHPTPLRGGHDAAGRAAHQPGRRLHRHDEAVAVAVNVDHVQRLEPHQQIAAHAVQMSRCRIRAARTTGRRLGHVEASQGQGCLVAPDPGGLDPYPAITTAPGVSPGHPPQLRRAGLRRSATTGDPVYSGDRWGVELATRRVAEDERRPGRRPRRDHR